VDHLYAFFVQWSPDVYGKEAREQGFVVVEKDELNMIDNFFSDPKSSRSWEVCSHGMTLVCVVLYVRIVFKCFVTLDYAFFLCLAQAVFNVLTMH
jgi:hypothetical protein